MNDTELMIDIIHYAKDKMLQECGVCAIAFLPGKFAEATSTRTTGKELRVEITLKEKGQPCN